MSSAESSKGYIETAYNLSFNNSVESRTTDIAFKHNFTTELEIFGDYDHAKVGEIVAEDRGSFGVGYDPSITKKWSIWLDLTRGYDKVMGIIAEDYAGGGPKYYFLNRNDLSLSISTGLLFSRIKTDSGDAQEDRRWSWRFKYKDKKLLMVYFYQPSYNNRDDIISKFDGSFEIADIDKISILLYYKRVHKTSYGLFTDKGIKLRYKY